MVKISFTKRLQSIIVFLIAITISFLFVSSLNSFISRTSSLLILTEDDPGRVGSISQCSGIVDKRGVNQSVVAYSLFGPFFTNPSHFARYASRLKENAERIQKVYKGWIVRIYVRSTSSLDPPFIFLREYFHSTAHVDVCNATGALKSREIDVDVNPTTWRFLPLLDPTVKRVIFRDTDSLVSDREVDAVNEWIKSGTTFHIMRDYVGHCEYPMLAGIWGANLKRSENREKVLKAADELFNDPRLYKLVIQDRKGIDQELLTTHIWPLTSLNDDSALSHDSYCCDIFNNTRPFPTQRKGQDYVGKIHNGPLSVSISSPCPQLCKPHDHPDWTFC